MEANALYYPHIELHDPSLIKTMALFYDRIYRIVPGNVTPNDSEELAAFLEEGSVGRAIDPSRYSSRASTEFMSKIEDWNAAALVHDDDEEQAITRLHKDKTDERVRALFREAGFKEDDKWMSVPTEFASNFMLFLATQIAEQERLSLITSDWGAWTGTNYFGIDGKIDEFLLNSNFTEGELAEGFGLFSLIVSDLTPVNIAEIPAGNILEFREVRHSEILAFRSCLSELREELATLESSGIVVDTIQGRVRQLARAQDELKRSADLLKVKGWIGTSLIGFPAPLAFVQIFDIPDSAAAILTAAGIAIGLMFNIESTKEELKKLNRQQPASFLTELHRSFKDYTSERGGGDINFHAYNCMEEYVND